MASITATIPGRTRRYVTLRSYITVSIVVIVFIRPACGHAQVSITQPANKTSSVNEGGRLTIICSTSLGGAIDWLHNGLPIQIMAESLRYNVRTVTNGNTSRHHLTVYDVTPRDAGTYTCRQTFTDDRNLNVNRLDTVQIIDPLKESSLSLLNGNNLTMTCLGDNAAVLAWYQSGKLVTSSDDRLDDVSLERDLDTNRQTSFLTRPAMTSREAGQYQCRDQTKHLADSRIISVHVTTVAELTNLADVSCRSSWMLLVSWPLLVQGVAIWCDC